MIRFVAVDVDVVCGLGMTEEGERGRSFLARRAGRRGCPGNPRITPEQYCENRSRRHVMAAQMTRDSQSASPDRRTAANSHPRRIVLPSEDCADRRRLLGSRRLVDHRAGKRS